MDGSSFDRITRMLAERRSRRTTLGMVGAALALGAGEAAAKRRDRKSNRAGDPPGKTSICHYDKDAQSYAEIRVSNRSLDAHWMHGDFLAGGCCNSAECTGSTDTCTPISQSATSARACTCGSGEACSGTTPECMGGTCVCTADSCEEGYACEAGACVPLCSPACEGSTPDCVEGTCVCNAESCPSGYACEDGACVLIPTCEPACSGATPDCVDLVCVCNQGSCPASQACTGGTCVAVTPNGALDPGDATFDRRCVNGYYGYEYYEAIPYVHPGGPFTRYMTAGFDTYLILYSTFDPTQACNGIVAENDDSFQCGDYTLNSMIHLDALDAGTYTIVATSYNSGSTGSYSLTEDPPVCPTGSARKVRKPAKRR